MTVETTSIDTLVVGAGQAGVAMSEHLSKLGVPHLVLERARIAERWRTGRWDSLVANGPAWHDRFPNMEFADVDPDAFAGKEQVAPGLRERQTTRVMPYEKLHAERHFQVRERRRDRRLRDVQTLRGRRERQRFRRDDEVAQLAQ